MAGVDEVGRGPLAGPVIAAAVVFAPEAEPIEGLRDSKQLTARRREVMEGIIHDRVAAWALGAASVREIDRSNILRATARAMRRAIARLPKVPDVLLIDGSPFPELRIAHRSLVGGDAVCQSIAAASVLAKCARDRLMIRLAERYPVYRWERNKGYATAHHRRMLQEHGCTPHHRRSFAPVEDLQLF